MTSRLVAATDVRSAESRRFVIASAEGARQSVLFQGELRIFLRTLKKHIVKKPLIQRFFNYCILF